MNKNQDYSKDNAKSFKDYLKYKVGGVKAIGKLKWRIKVIWRSFESQNWELKSFEEQSGESRSFESHLKVISWRILHFYHFILFPNQITYLSNFIKTSEYTLYIYI